MNRELTTIVNAQITFIAKEDKVWRPIDYEMLNTELKQRIIDDIKEGTGADDVTAEIKFFLSD